MTIDGTNWKDSQGIDTHCFTGQQWEREGDAKEGNF